MRKYLTWRCIGLHVLVLVLVPAFLLAGWWQYHVALGGNDLSWVYTVEWPFFAVYAVYIWWRLIHDEGTPFDRLWAAKQRAAADAEGRPLHEIPGWATDGGLSREVRRASRDAARRPALSGSGLHARGLNAPKQPSPMPAVSLGVEQPLPLPIASRSNFEGDGDGDDNRDSVIDAQVLEVKVTVDEELDAYNRYLFDLSRTGRPKRWGSGRTGRGSDGPRSGALAPLPREQPALRRTNEDS
jgi:hypothetical protein